MTFRCAAQYLVRAWGSGRRPAGASGGRRQQELGEAGNRGEVELNFRLVAVDLPAVTGTGGRVQELRLIVILLLQSQV